jgi:hypothetical protein
MCTIGIFIIGHALSSAFGYRISRGSILWQKLVAMVRYLAYRGFHIRALGWSSAPVGVLILGLIGTIFFFCKPQINAWCGCALIYLRAWFWLPSHITGQISCLVDRHHSQLALAGWLWRVCRSYCTCASRRKVFKTLTFAAQRRPRPIGLRCSLEFRTRDFRSSTDGYPMPSSFSHYYTLSHGTRKSSSLLLPYLANL